MSQDDDLAPDRRSLIRLAAAGGLLAAAFAASTARAQGTTAKADVKYQFTPKPDGSRCELCTSFIAPAQDGPGPGMCRIVAGPIPRNGWCVLFAHR